MLAQINTDDVELINIKTHPINADDLETAYRHIGSYEALFNKHARKYKAMSPDEKPTNDADYKKLILSDYTFLKRPVAFIGDTITAGNTQENIGILQCLLGAK